MNAMMKLTAAALGALSIAGGVAVAQTSASADDNDARSQTANYGTPPGAPLKRDGSLRADPKPTTTISAPMATDTSTTTTTNTTSVTTPAAPVVADTPAPAPAVDNSAMAPAPDTSLQPRADRN
jgi:hypothetical protein